MQLMAIKKNITSYRSMSLVVIGFSFSFSISNLIVNYNNKFFIKGLRSHRKINEQLAFV